MAPAPNPLPFSVNSRLLAGGTTASDDEVRTAMLFAFEQFKIVIEAGAAVGLAAVLNSRITIKGRSVVVIITGGNADAASFSAGLLSAKSKG